MVDRPDGGYGPIMAPLEMRLPPSTHVLPELRATIARRLESIEEPADDWLLIATELVTNAIEASPPSAPIDVRLRSTADTVELTVVDHGPGYDLPPLSIDVPPLQLGGRGLVIVRSLSDALETRRVAESTVTRCVRSRSTLQQSA